MSVYIPDQVGLAFPQVPAYTRLECRRRLVVACRAFAERGFDYGFAGHVTLRDPLEPDTFWANPMAVHLSQVRIGDLIRVNHAGEVVEGRYAINHAGFCLHSSIHRLHPDIVAVVHAHTLYGTAFAATGRGIEPISQDATVFFEDHVVIDEQAGAAVLRVDAGTMIAEKIGSAKAAIHQNHGLFTFSRHSIDEAAFWFIALERACQQALLVETPILVEPERARHSREQIGNALAGWLHFQPIYEDLVARHPEMFE